jgi:quinoprotein dehydrogenase-associated probable ABC transporter substrate-binding protein
MSSACRRACALVLLALCSAAGAAGQRELRVCADPDNLPYSHRDESGFENRIARVLAAELNAALRYAWLPQGRGYVRKTLNAGACDLIIGVPAAYEPVLTTSPYYRSTYVFVYRAGDAHAYRSFDDPQLRRVRVGVQLVGDDLAATPPGHALAQRGIVDNVVGYPVYGERTQAERMVAAVARRELDVALLWGPQAGYYAARSQPPLAWSRAAAPPGLPAVPFEFSMAAGVRKSDTALRDELDAAIARRHDDIDAILREYGVPRAENLQP